MEKELTSFGFLKNWVIDGGECTGCGACVNLCPYFVLHGGVIVTPDACDLEEGRCLNFCPKGIGDSDPLSQKLWEGTKDGSPLGPVKEIAMAKVSAPTPNAQYGGVVTAILRAALSEKTYHGALTTRWRDAAYPTGQMVKHPDEAAACSGVHYATSYSLSALNEYRKTNPGPLILVGLPCQMLAARRMLSYEHPHNPHTGSDDLLVGLFCTWALSPRPFLAELTRRFGDRKIIKYDIPPPPANRFDITFEGGDRVEIPLEEIRPFINPGCRTCPDMTAEFADISVGAAEGFEGWNTLIVRTDKGASLIHQLLEREILTTREMPEASLSHLSEAASQKRTRALKARRLPPSTPRRDPA